MPQIKFIIEILDSLIVYLESSIMTVSSPKKLNQILLLLVNTKNQISHF